MERAFSKLVRKPHTRNPLPSETVGVRYKSEVSDVIHYADGSVETINHGHNVMLNSFLPLITDLLVNGKDRQLKYWAVGSGDASWDTEPKQEKLSSQSIKPVRVMVKSRLLLLVKSTR